MRLHASYHGFAAWCVGFMMHWTYAAAHLRHDWVARGGGQSRILNRLRASLMRCGDTAGVAAVAKVCPDSRRTGHCVAVGCSAMLLLRHARPHSRLC
jgi:hypothetical protein